MKTFKVWRSQYIRHKYGDGYSTEWFPCNDIIKARSKKGAQSKLDRKSRKAGFHSMILAAFPVGVNPNAE